MWEGPSSVSSPLHPITKIILSAVLRRPPWSRATQISELATIHPHATNCQGPVTDENLRTGYSDNGERLVAGIVPTNKEKTFVLLIQSTRRAAWVLPKGGWETDEECIEAAEREAWEEAGIVCKIDYDLGTISETRAPKQISKDAPRALYQFYEATVVEEKSEWPERHKRSRKWFSYAEAIEALQPRPELAEALKRSTVKR